MKDKSKKWRVTVSVPAEWQPVIKAELAKRGLTLSKVMIKTLRQYGEPEVK